jgi:hypothetical protein
MDGAGVRKLGMLQERQLPSHDLDAALCDSLTEIELDEFDAFLDLKSAGFFGVACLGVFMCKNCYFILLFFNIIKKICCRENRHCVGQVSRQGKQVMCTQCREPILQQKLGGLRNFLIFNLPSPVAH